MLPYLHFDGYPEHAGVVINQWYNLHREGFGVDRRRRTAKFELERWGTTSISPGSTPKASLRPDFADDVRSRLRCDYLYVFEDGHWHCHKL